MSMSLNQKGLNSEINVTPLVDVMLVLLIIFMVITPMLQKGKAVQLPTVPKPEKQADSGNDLVVSLEYGGGMPARYRVYLGQFLVEEASLRGRLGYAWDRVMVYGTGGVAFADASANGVVNGASFDTSRYLTGWTVGAGVDYAITNNWVGRVEYRYYDFSNEDFGDLSNVDLDFNTVSVGISYKF